MLMLTRVLLKASYECASSFPDTFRKFNASSDDALARSPSRIVSRAPPAKHPGLLRLRDSALPLHDVRWPWQLRRNGGRHFPSCRRVAKQSMLVRASISLIGIICLLPTHAASYAHINETVGAASLPSTSGLYEFVCKDPSYDTSLAANVGLCDVTLGKQVRVDDFCCVERHSLDHAN